MTPSELRALRERDRAVLMHNVREYMVTPSDELYGADGNSWGYLWDTLFAVGAIAADDAPLAAYLLRNYLAAQRPNGMVPHMVMWSSGFPYGSIVTDIVWQGYRGKGHDVARRPVKTSPITQPPLLAVAAGQIADGLASDRERAAFSRDVARRLVAYHGWLYRERELTGDGLVATIHPHETGRDDAPSHVALMRAIPLTAGERFLLSPRIQRAYERNRTDLDHGNKDITERSATDTVLRASLLAMFRLPATRRAMRRTGQTRIPLSHPYLHLDPGFNAILDRANTELTRLAAMGEVDVSPQLVDAMARTSAGLQRLWDGPAQAFRGLDLHGVVTLDAGQEIGDLLPIYSDNITSGQTDAILALLDDDRQFGGAHLPSVNRRSPAYAPNRFWNGPAWPPTIELTLDGLDRKASPPAHKTATRIGEAALVDAMRDDTRPEYRNSLTGEPRGAHQFSWTAALTVNTVDRLGRDSDGQPGR